VELNDVVEAKVLGVDVENKRISLGMRQLESNPWDVVEENYPVGTIIKGAVRNITDFGVFVGIEEGIDGLVHISDLSWSQRIKHPSEIFAKGDEIEARVLNIDRDNERFSLGIKQLGDDPWLSVQSRYFLGQVVKGTVVSRTDFGVFVEIEQGIEGLVHMSELSVPEGEWEGVYPDGRELSVEIRRIDPHDRKLSLSEAGPDDEGDSGDGAGFIARQSESSNARLGDVLGDLSAKLGVSGTAAEAPAEEATAEEAPAEEATAEEAPAEEAPAEEAAAEEAPAEEAAAEEAAAEEAAAEDAEAASEE
jgi:small subunit ribosomal protein S1